jgi:mono/diheme cytochrome c family protein
MVFELLDRPIRIAVGVGMIFFLAAGSVARSDEPPDFRAQVAPILERHCVGCHQGEKAKGGLILADAVRALAGGESGAAIIPGKPAESLLVEYISGDKPEMPKDAPPLKPDEVQAIRRWIGAGAVWPEGLTLADKHEIDANWWSLKPLAEHTVPKLDSPWVRTPIDAFVLDKLRASGLEPSAEADRRVLIRRLTYDLHGLPPTPAEIDAFVADPAADAYDRLVDRLLDSPRYGERWARHWLDVVHYGETHGYDKDKTRPNAWPYRDYVITALNQDKPYDRFILDQLAGDVLFPEEADSVVATGFIAAGPWDAVGHTELREGTVDKDIARSNDRDDMVASTCSTFLSLTVQCARCHNHKFDPIKQTDYYHLQAVFAGIDRADRPYDPDPQVGHARRALVARTRELDARRQNLERAFAAAMTPEATALEQRIKQMSTELAATPVEEGRRSPTLGYHSQITDRPDVTKWVQVDLGSTRAIDEVILVPAYVVYGGHPGPGFGFPPRFRVEISDDPGFSQATVIADHTSTDFANPGEVPVRIDTAGKAARFVRFTANKLWKRTDDWCVALAEMVVLSDKTDIARGAPVTALDSIEAGPSWAQVNLVDGYSSLEQLQFEGDGALTHRQQLAIEIDKLGTERTRLFNTLLGADARQQMTQVSEQLAEVRRQTEALPPPRMVYGPTHEFAPAAQLTPALKPRPIYLLARGDVRSPLELMAPGAVATVPGPDATFALSNPDDEGQRRVALARWLSDPSNVLVRRSIVNRVWHYHFGQGIVDTPNDFGRMGSLPSHPELLDWLARWFLDQGESLKSLHRLIVTSAVYRQVSTEEPAAAKIDGSNRLLWRMNRARLDAESVRDGMLAISGKLDLQMGGPSVQQFFFKDDHSPVYDYARFDVEDPKSFRRSIYRYIVRSVPDPFMESLDCADPSLLTPKRNVTLTAIQALTLYNNRFVLAQAEHLAQRVSQMHSEPAAQVQAAYRLCLGRSPTADESRALEAYVGRFGLANACRVIFNSNEFLFVD